MKELDLQAVFMLVTSVVTRYFISCFSTCFRSKQTFNFMHQREARFVQLHLLNTVIQRLLVIKYKYRVHQAHRINFLRIRAHEIIK